MAGRSWRRRPRICAPAKTPRYGQTRELPIAKKVLGFQPLHGLQNRDAHDGWRSWRGFGGGFRRWGSLGRVATDKMFGMTTKRLTAEALLAKAARAERIAATLDHLSENWSISVGRPSKAPGPMALNLLLGIQPRIASLT